MKTSLSSKRGKLLAVLGEDGNGIFFRKGDGNIYINEDCEVDEGTLSLEELLKQTGRKPIYEGEEITLQF